MFVRSQRIGLSSTAPVPFVDRDDGEGVSTARALPVGPDVCRWRSLQPALRGVVQTSGGSPLMNSVSSSRSDCSMLMQGHLIVGVERC
jgi:hypothetical protein